jgi:hypothetical protein
MGKASSVSSTTVQVQEYDAQPTFFHHSAQPLAGADLACPDVEFGAILGLGWPGGSSRCRLGRRNSVAARCSSDEDERELDGLCPRH